MLATLPPEILESIGYQLVLEEHTPPVPLLCTCHSIYDAVSPESNPNVYARVFKELYDVAAAERRLGPLSSKEMLAELKTRYGALRRWKKRFTESQDHRDSLGKDSVHTDDSWVVFLMLIENDGKNLAHILPDESTTTTRLGAAHLHTNNGYPPKDFADALDMWIDWMLDDYAIKARKRHSLRPYVFAAQEYDLFWAPWTQRQLPIEVADSHAPAASFMHNPVPQNLGRKIKHFGREIEIGSPILCHAAMLRFFASVGGYGANSSSGFSVTGDSDSASEPAVASWDFGAGTADLRALPRPSLKSANHDADFARLLSCTNGQQSPGLPLRASRGVFAGLWEGTFTFLDYDAFRDMLSGGREPMYYGAYGEQAQVWKLRETVVRRGRGTERGWPLCGPMTNAGYPTDLRAFAMNPKHDHPQLHPDDATIADALGRQMAAWEGWDTVPEEEVDALLAAEAAATASVPSSAAAGGDLAILVTGVGHSAWGRFVLTGHVRPWDGLVYLVKEYAPFQRGKWLYRGYVLGGGVMVGRWRDAVTPEEYVGYEGTYILSKRSTW